MYVIQHHHQHEALPFRFHADVPKERTIQAPYCN